MAVAYFSGRVSSILVGPLSAVAWFVRRFGLVGLWTSLRRRSFFL